MINRKFLLSGMIMQVISDQGDKWEMLNLTTRDRVYMDKSVLDQAIRLGKAEEISDQD